jgi:hypothetical protein
VCLGRTFIFNIEIAVGNTGYQYQQQKIKKKIFILTCFLCDYNKASICYAISDRATIKINTTALALQPFSARSLGHLSQLEKAKMDNMFLR